MLYTSFLIQDFSTNLHVRSSHKQYWIFETPIMTESASQEDVSLHHFISERKKNLNYTTPPPPPPPQKKKSLRSCIQNIALISLHVND